MPSNGFHLNAANGSGEVFGSAGSSGSGPQFAESTRSVEGPPLASGAASVPSTSHQPEPDLDALARQVYTILKRRLAVERSRLG
jgi:hypothetical protein